MSMVHLVVAYFVALTDHLGSKIFTPTVVNPGREFRLLFSVVMGIILLYGMLFALAYQQEMRKDKK